MKQSNVKKTLAAVLLAGWCLLFLRCETTEKSMVRALYLAQEGQQYRVGLLYQAPEAAADASEASAALQFVQAEGESLQKALAAAEDALPQTANYRLCDYLLLPDAAPALLEEYEQLVLQRACGRTAARLVRAEGELTALEETQALPDALLKALQSAAAGMPRLYQHREPFLLPCVQWQEETAAVLPGGALCTGAEAVPLDAAQTEVFYLLTGAGGSRTVWLGGEPVTIRRCTVSVTLHGDAAVLRLDCQRPPQSPLPDAAQCAELAAQCQRLVQDCWQRGIDLLHLEQRAALYSGRGEAFALTKNACPQLRTDVHFLPL